jgi:hypothetical protein
VEQSPAVSTADVTSSAVGAGATTTSAAVKAGTSTALSARGEQDDLCMADPQLTPDPQTTEARGARTKDDIDRCLYIGTPWDDDVTADRRDVDDFKEASRTIGRILTVMIRVSMLQSLSLIPAILQGLRSKFLCFCCSRLPNELRLGQVCCLRRPMPTQRLPRPTRLRCKPRSGLRRRFSM